MSKRALWVWALSSVVSVGCSNGSSGGAAGPDGGTTGGGTSLAGIWDLTTTPTGSNAVVTTVSLGQDSLTVTSPGFTLTATRTGGARTFTDEQTPGTPSDDVVLSATQTGATFDAGILPFDLGGSWTMSIVPAGQSAVMTCTLTVGASEIDGSCQKLSSDGLDFSFTTTKTAPAASSLGDLGGTWASTFTLPGSGGGTYPCELDFTGNSITTCAGGGGTNDSPLSGITFTYDGANTASGSAQGWAEFSATRR